MRNLITVIGALAVFSLSATVSAQSLFERCEKQKGEIANLKNEVGDLSGQIQTIDRELADLALKMRELRTEKVKKSRQKAGLEKKVKRNEAKHRRRCRALRQCDTVENKVVKLKTKIAPLAERLHRIGEEIGTRQSAVADLNRDIGRMDTQFDKLGCDNLQIGQTAQTTFDRCSQLSKDFSGVQNRISQLQASVLRLRKTYQKIMKKMRSNGKELASLLKIMRDACSHSKRLADLEDMEKKQNEYRSIKDKLDEMDTKVKRFKTLKLLKAKPGKGKRSIKGKKTSGSTGTSGSTSGSSSKKKKRTP